MKREEFLNLIIEKVDSEYEITETDVIAEIEEWDSLVSLEVLALFMKHFGFQPDIDTIRECNTVKMLLDLANGKYEEDA